MRLPETLFHRVLLPQELVVLGALAVVLACAVPRHRRRPAADQAARHKQRVAVFALIVLAGVILNAVICAAVSGPWGWFHARTVWLIPMMAVLLIEVALQGSGWRVLRWRARASQAVPAEIDREQPLVPPGAGLGATLLHGASSPSR